MHLTMFELTVVGDQSFINPVKHAKIRCLCVIAIKCFVKQFAICYDMLILVIVVPCHVTIP